MNKLLTLLTEICHFERLSRNLSLFKKIATSLTLLIVTLLFLLIVIPTPVLASHCDDLNPPIDQNENPDEYATCASRVQQQPTYCDGNQIFENLPNGEHRPASPNCATGQICVTINPSVNGETPIGNRVVECEYPNGTGNNPPLGGSCEYPQPVNGQIQNCHGRYNYDPNDPSKSTITCQPYPGIDPQCSVAASPGTVDQIFGKIQAPSFVSGIGFGSAGLSQFLKTIIGLIYTASIIAFVVMILVSAFQWITSGGDKEALSKARGRLTNAVIGITLLALAGLLIVTLGKILGFKFFG